MCLKLKSCFFLPKKVEPVSKLPSLYINKQKLDYVEDFKYLGITLDRKHNFHKHFLETMSNLNHKLYMCYVRSDHSLKLIQQFCSIYEPSTLLSRLWSHFVPRNTCSSLMQNSAVPKQGFENKP